jgi:myo-inositol 2-dehydrogenase/D-chiro-inositol 1-dehydrogenase
MNRRQLLVTGSQAISGMMLLRATTAFGYQANSAVRHGLLGCGNRGTSVASSFSQNTSAQVVALADLFPDQLAAGKDHFDTLSSNWRHRRTLI